MPPERPSPVAVGTLVESTPFASKPYTPLDEETTTSQEPRTTMQRRAPSKAPLFLAVALMAAVIAATIVWFVARKDSRAVEDKPSATVTKDAKDVKPLSSSELARLKQDCLDYEKTLFWKELKECSDRLRSYDKPLGDKLWEKADDEAANEKKWRAVQKYIDEKDFGKARDLVKRIEGSVYTERAHKLLEEAEASATSSPASP